MLYVSKSYTKQATEMPRTNYPFWNENKNDAFWNVTRTILFLEIGMKQKQCVLEQTRMILFGNWNETRMILFGNGKVQF